MKRCQRCLQSFPATTQYWHKDSTKPDGFDKQCKTCKAERRADLYARNADAEKALVSAWRRANPDRKRAQHMARRARKISNGPTELVSYFKVFMRDNGECKLCGGIIPPGVAWPDPKAGTIDHIVPLSRGGMHTYENVQLAHSVCNSRKGNRYE